MFTALQSLSPLLVASPLSLLPTWLVVAGIAVAFFAAFRAGRRRQRVRELLFQGHGAKRPAGEAESPATNIDEPDGPLTRWLAAAGHDGPGARLNFLLRCTVALFCALFLALLFDASGFIESAILWLQEIPGGIADLFVPVMRASTWLVAGLVALLPVVWVRRDRRRRVDEVERDLPTVLSLLATLVESGLGFDAAARRVEVALGDRRVISEELARVRASTLAGVSRAKAIRSMAQRLDVPSMTVFSSALVHAENQGASIGDTLRRQATDLWSRRREEAIQRAQTLPAKLAFPLVLCFLPGVFVWTFGPAVADFVRLTGSAVTGRP